ncbi:MAG: hypothetical protein NC485_04380 [Ruminococcus flavefaciens]|nr:hypothetical protein [Ruminococcus flavefaciens]MCM1058913.1 hypothetical protein [Eubacterium sp.]
MVRIALWGNNMDFFDFFIFEVIEIFGWLVNYIVETRHEIKRDKERRRERKNNQK